MTTTIRDLRRRAALTEAEMARLTCTDVDAVAAIEDGACPPLPTAMRMARALTTDVENLFPEHVGRGVPVRPTTTTTGDPTEDPITGPFFAVSHVGDPERLKTLRRELLVLLDGEPAMVRRSNDVEILDGAHVLALCEDAGKHVTMDADGARRMTAILVQVVEAALRGLDTPRIVAQNALLDDIGRMIGARAAGDQDPLVEVMVECPLPWRPNAVVRTDLKSGVGMWSKPRPDLAELVPPLPSILQISIMDEGIRFRGWGRRTILTRVPDAMETLRLSRDVETGARSLVDAAHGRRS